MGGEAQGANELEGYKRIHAICSSHFIGRKNEATLELPDPVLFVYVMLGENCLQREDIVPDIEIHVQNYNFFFPLRII